MSSFLREGSFILIPINWVKSAFLQGEINVTLDCLYLYPPQEEDLTILHVDRQEKSKPDSILTSTPALFSNPGSKRRANTSIFGEPLPMSEASTSRAVNKSRPQLFLPSPESRPGPQPFSLPKNRPSFSVSAFGSPLPVSYFDLIWCYNDVCVLFVINYHTFNGFLIIWTTVNLTSLKNSNWKQFPCFILSL